MHAQLCPGVVASLAVVSRAVALLLHLAAEAAVKAGGAAGPDPLADQAVGQGQHGDREEEEGQAEVDGVVVVGEPGGEHSRASLNGGNNT